MCIGEYRPSGDTDQGGKTVFDDNKENDEVSSGFKLFLVLAFIGVLTAIFTYLDS